ncbi:MAG: ATP-binding cassette domain-containing protein, partial [Promethearchaeia archaeon]
TIGKTKGEVTLQKTGTIDLIPGLSALKNVKVPMKLADAPKDHVDKRARELLETFNLDHRIDHKPNQLSGGENQRVAICVALANQPELLLADEVTGELDTETAAIVMDALRKTNREFGTTIINVTHNPRVAEYADRILRIRDGLIEGQKHTLYGDITEIDAKGRLVIPEAVRRMAGLEKRVVLRATSEGLLIRPLDTEEDME